MRLMSTATMQLVWQGHFCLICKLHRTLAVCVIGMLLLDLSNPPMLQAACRYVRWSVTTPLDNNQT